MTTEKSSALKAIAGRQDVSARNRPRRQSKSAFWSLAQVVLGGVAAVPIALLLIWHLIGTDVADMGPTVGRYAPWLVPEKFRPYDVAPGTSNLGGPRTAPSTGTSGFRRFDDVLPPELEPTAEPSPAPEGEELAANDQASAPDASTPVVQPTTSASEADLAPAKTDKPQAEPNDSTDVFSQIRKTNSGLADWTAAMDPTEAGQRTPDLKTIARVVYDDFIELARRIEGVPKSNPLMRTVRDQMKGTASLVADRPDVQNVLVQGTQFWLSKNEDLPSFSLATVVEVASVNLDEETWTIEASQATPFEIRISKELMDSPETTQKLLLLGTVRKSEASQKAVFTANYLGRL